ncbi:MAG: molybdate ABC transporter substrate-binding protein [Oscillospiraceae bacterium]|nr:molybdate ABC transporter substrate-binding protein [Oscillospiraceae bacterium]
MKSIFKKPLALALALALSIALFACKSTPAASPTPSADTPPVESVTPPEETATPDPLSGDLIVFAAASMTESMNALAAEFNKANPGVNVIFTFDSSGTLQTQIEEGAEADIFVSAAQKQMNALAEKELVNTATRFDLLENKVALVVPDGNPKNILTFEDAAKAEKIALGGADVPVGAYSEEIFTAMGVWDEMQSRITFGANVKEVAAWIKEGVADCGVVYATDAAAQKLTIVGYAPEGTLKTPIIYPASALAGAKNTAAAEAFLAFLQTSEAKAILTEYGFAPLG